MTSTLRVKRWNAMIGDWFCMMLVWVGNWGFDWYLSLKKWQRYSEIPLRRLLSILQPAQTGKRSKKGGKVWLKIDFTWFYVWFQIGFFAFWFVFTSLRNDLMIGYGNSSFLQTTYTGKKTIQRNILIGDWHNMLLLSVRDWFLDWNWHLCQYIR